MYGYVHGRDCVVFPLLHVYVHHGRVLHVYVLLRDCVVLVDDHVHGREVFPAHPTLSNFQFYRWYPSNMDEPISAHEYPHAFELFHEYVRAWITGCSPRLSSGFDHLSY